MRCPSTSIPARQFYEQHGLEVCGEPETHWLMRSAF